MSEAQRSAFAPLPRLTRRAPSLPHSNVVRSFAQASVATLCHHRGPQWDDGADPAAQKGRCRAVYQTRHDRRNCPLGPVYQHDTHLGLHALRGRLDRREPSALLAPRGVSHIYTYVRLSVGGEEGGHIPAVHRRRVPGHVRRRAPHRLLPAPRAPLHVRPQHRRRPQADLGRAVRLRPPPKLHRLDIAHRRDDHHVERARVVVRGDRGAEHDGGAHDRGAVHVLQPVHHQRAFPAHGARGRGAEEGVRRSVGPVDEAHALQDFSGHPLIGERGSHWSYLSTCRWFST